MKFSSLLRFHLPSSQISSSFSLPTIASVFMSDSPLSLRLLDSAIIKIVAVYDIFSQHFFMLLSIVAVESGILWTVPATIPVPFQQWAYRSGMPKVEANRQHFFPCIDWVRKSVVGGRGSSTLISNLRSISTSNPQGYRGEWYGFLALKPL